MAKARSRMMAVAMTNSVRFMWSFLASAVAASGRRLGAYRLFRRRDRRTGVAREIGRIGCPAAPCGCRCGCSDAGRGLDACLRVRRLRRPPAPSATNSIRRLASRPSSVPLSAIGLRLAVAHRRHPRHIDPPALQGHQNRLGPGLTQRLIAAFRALGIGMAADFHLQRRGSPSAPRPAPPCIGAASAAISAEPGVKVIFCRATTAFTSAAHSCGVGRAASGSSSSS